MCIRALASMVLIVLGLLFRSKTDQDLSTLPCALQCPPCTLHTATALSVHPYPVVYKLRIDRHWLGGGKRPKIRFLWPQNAGFRILDGLRLGLEKIMLHLFLNQFCKWFLHGPFSRPMAFWG